MDFDSILPDVGSFGLFQKLVITMLLPAVLPCAFHAYRYLFLLKFRIIKEVIFEIIFSQLFIASRQNHWCRVPELEPWVQDYPELVKNIR